MKWLELEWCKAADCRREIKTPDPRHRNRALFRTMQFAYTMSGPESNFSAKNLRRCPGVARRSGTNVNIRGKRLCSRRKPSIEPVVADQWIDDFSCERALRRSPSNDGIAHHPPANSSSSEHLWRARTFANIVRWTMAGVQANEHEHPPLRGVRMFATLFA